MNSSDHHYVSLLRRPSYRGRLAILAVCAIAIGPGGLLLFRVTEAHFAEKQPSDQSATDNVQGSAKLDAAAAENAVGWQSSPSWDLTQQANGAWMVVDRTTGERTSVDRDRAVANSQPNGDDIRLVSDEETVVPPAVPGSFGIPSPPRPEENPFADASTAPAAPRVPQSDELSETRKDFQGWGEEYFVNTQAETSDQAAAADETVIPPAEPEMAPVAPPADAAPTPAPPTAGETAQNPPLIDVPAEDPFPQPLTTGPCCDSPKQDHVFVQAPTAMCQGYPCETAPHPRCGVHCNGEACCQDLRWKDSWLIPWEVFAQGEYLGPTRTPHVPEYRLRVDDQIEFVYRLTGERSTEPYLINTGDTLRVESLTSELLNRDVLVQPDGTVSLPNLGQVLVAGRSIDEVRRDLETRYEEHVRNPAITVTPIELNTVLEELRATVDNRFGNGGQSRYATVTPEGTVQLPAIGSVPAHGLTLDELAAEIRYRYAEIVHGLEVTPILAERAPHYVYVVGEVKVPGRFSLEGPTTLMQAVAMAGGWNVGANLTQVVVFRRDECWRLMATKVGLRRPLYGKDPCPDGELWLRDSDIVVVPKSPILVADEFIDLVFTRGVYGVIPFSTNLSYVRDLSGAASVIPVP